MITFAVIIWASATIVSILSKVIWSPDQIIKNFKLKSTKGLSSKFIIIGFVAHVLWTIHWLIREDYYLVIGQWLWAFTFGIIIYQIILYNKN